MMAMRAVSGVEVDEPNLFFFENFLNPTPDSLPRLIRTPLRGSRPWKLKIAK